MKVSITADSLWLWVLMQWTLSAYAEWPLKQALLTKRSRIVKRHAVTIDKSQICQAFGCLNGNCLESELKKFRIVCVCYPGFEGKLCDKRTCPIPCGKHGKCVGAGGIMQCLCDRGYSGASCNSTVSQGHVPAISSRQHDQKKTIPVQLQIGGKDGPVIISGLASILKSPPSGRKGLDIIEPPESWFSNSSPSDPFHSHAVLARDVEPEVCAPGFECYHGHCDRDYMAQGRFRCLCDANYTGVFCDKSCELKCRHGLCYADPHGHQFCMCQWGYTGKLCQRRRRRKG